jgi:hypothetical protein
LDFLRAYMEDSLGPRAWVDDQEDAACRLFVANLRTCWSSAAAAEALRDAATGASASAGASKPTTPQLSSSSSARGTPSSTPLQPPSATPAAMAAAAAAAAAVAGTTDSMPPPPPLLPPLALPPPQLGVVSSSVSLATSTQQGNGSDDSDSGDEEVLEEAVVGVFDASTASAASTPLSLAAPAPTALSAAPSSSSVSSSRPLPSPTGEEELPQVWPRYSERNAEPARELVLAIVRERLEAAAAQYQSMWPVIATLVETAGLPQCRLLAAEHLQRWLETPAQSRNARTLLAALAKAVDPAVKEDGDLTLGLLRLRVPTQQTELYVESVATIVQKAPVFLQQAVGAFLEGAVTGDRPDAHRTLALVLQQALVAVGGTGR